MFFPLPKEACAFIQKSHFALTFKNLWFYELPSLFLLLIYLFRESWWSSKSFKALVILIWKLKKCVDEMVSLCLISFYCFLSVLAVVNNNILKTRESFSVPVTTAEFAVMKTACSVWSGNNPVFDLFFS